MVQPASGAVVAIATEAVAAEFDNQVSPTTSAAAAFYATQHTVDTQCGSGSS
jgi:hypothetical protein